MKNNNEEKRKREWELKRKAGIEAGNEIRQKSLEEFEWKTVLRVKRFTIEAEFELELIPRLRGIDRI